MPMPGRYGTIKVRQVGPRPVKSTAWSTAVRANARMVFDDTNVIRTSVGVGLIWASPFGPLRFDYAIPITKGKYDVVQEFKFGGGTSF